jgi:hypothetical protein
MPERVRPIDVYRKIVDHRRTLNGLGHYNGNEHTIQKCIRNGTPIPDDLLPGREIMKLSEEEREALSQLTSADVENEINYWEYYGR